MLRTRQAGQLRDIGDENLTIGPCIIFVRAVSGSRYDYMAARSELTVQRTFNNTVLISTFWTRGASDISHVRNTKTDPDRACKKQDSQPGIALRQARRGAPGAWCCLGVCRPRSRRRVNGVDATSGLTGHVFTMNVRTSEGDRPFYIVRLKERIQ